MIFKRYFINKIKPTKYFLCLLICLSLLLALQALSIDFYGLNALAGENAVGARKFDIVEISLLGVSALLTACMFWFTYHVTTSENSGYKRKNEYLDRLIKNNESVERSKILENQILDKQEAIMDKRAIRDAKDAAELDKLIDKLDMSDPKFKHFSAINKDADKDIPLFTGVGRFARRSRSESDLPSHSSFSNLKEISDVELLDQNNISRGTQTDTSNLIMPSILEPSILEPSLYSIPLTSVILIFYKMSPYLVYIFYSSVLFIIFMRCYTYLK